MNHVLGQVGNGDQGCQLHRRVQLLAASAIAALGVAVTAPSASASLLAYEPFGQAVGTFSSSSTDSGQIGFASTYSPQPNATGGTATILTGSLVSAFDPVTSGNSLSLNGTAGAEAYYNAFNTTNALGLPTDTVPTANNQVWISVLIDPTSTITAGGGQIGQIYLNTGSSGNADTINIGYNTSASHGTQLGYGFATTTGLNGAGFTGSSLATATVTENVPTLLVAELIYVSAGNDTLNLYVNPTSASSPVALSAMGLSLSGDSNTGGGTYLSGISVYSGGASNTFDEIRIGQSFSDVVPTPEPTSIAVIALGAIPLLRRRRAR